MRKKRSAADWDITDKQIRIVLMGTMRGLNLSFDELAQYLGTSIEELEKMMHEGLIPSKEITDKLGLDEVIPCSAQTCESDPSGFSQRYYRFSSTMYNQVRLVPRDKTLHLTLDIELNNKTMQTLLNVSMAFGESCAKFDHARALQLGDRRIITDEKGKMVGKWEIIAN